jgi:uncharacterized protein
VDSVDDVVAKVIAAGGGVIKESFDSLEGGRIALVSDPAGAVFGVWQPGSHKGAQLVNEPGAWAMSMLATGDSRAPSASMALSSAGTPRRSTQAGAR